MYFAYPNQGEIFYLCLLLTMVKGKIYHNQDICYIFNFIGATSYENLCTVNGHLYDSFKEACYAYDLLQDDREWLSCLQEAADFSMGS